MTEALAIIPFRHHKPPRTEPRDLLTASTSISGVVIGLPPFAQSVRLFVTYIEGTDERTIDIALPDCTLGPANPC